MCNTSVKKKASENSEKEEDNRDGGREKKASAKTRVPTAKRRDGPELQAGSVHPYCRTSPPATAFSVHILLRIPVNYTPARILFLELRNMQTQTVRNVEYFSQLVQGKGKNNLNKI